jgi:muramoyltetrapeptide carboxypeptidase
LKPLLPPPLVPGDRIGIAAPGGPIRPEAFGRGVSYLEARGFRPVFGRNLHRRKAYLAGTDRERLEDLAALLGDTTIKGIWCARGGYGSARIIAGLDLDPLRRHPKALIGYSDITTLHTAVLRKVRLASWHGPMVSELGDPALYDEAFLWKALSGDGGDLSWPLPASSIHRAGSGEGTLVGGCLAVLVGLVGTPYEPPMDGSVLFWEEVHEEPYRIDRMLGHLRLSGRLKNLRGMVVGRLVDCAAKDPENDMPLRDILDTHLEGTDFPVAIDFPAGHCAGKTTLPLGRTVRLDTASLRLAVSGR